MDMDKAIQNIFTVLDDLKPTDIIYVFADLCTIQGWRASVSVGDPDNVGDLSVTRVIPYPETVEVIYFEGDELSESQLRDWANDIELSNNNRLTIISQGTPTTRAFEFADERGIGILGVADVAKEIYQLSVENILAEVVAKDEALMEAHRSRLRELGCQIEKGTEASDPDTDTVQHDSADDGLLSDGVPSVKVDNQFLHFELLGYEHVDSSRYETEGIIAAVEIKAKKEDLEIAPEKFTLHSTDGYTYTAVNLTRSSSADPVAGKFAAKLVDSLPKKWSDPTSLGRYEISGGGRIKAILYFPCESGNSIGKIRYKANALRHLIDTSAEKIRSSFGIHPRAGRNDDSDLGSSDEYAFDVPLSDTQREYYNNLPDKVKSALE